MTIDPAYRLLLMYDIHPERYELYYRYVIHEFVPTMQQMGLYMLFAWHVHGEYPERQVEFVCESLTTLRNALKDERFKQAEDRLKSYTTSYRRKVVRFQNRYQF